MYSHASKESLHGPPGRRGLPRFRNEFARRQPLQDRVAGDQVRL
jgi:hypothetical protein